MAAAAARVALETLLRERKLDITLKSTAPDIGGLPAERVATTGVAALDHALAGGVPRGQVSEVIGPVSSGRTSLLHALLAGATSRGELAAVVDVRDSFDPTAAAVCGTRLAQVLWVRGEPVTATTTPALDPHWEPSRPRAGPQTPLGRALMRGVKALSLVVSAGGFGVVVFDVSGVPMRALRQLPFTTWLRLQRMIEGSDTACVLLADEPLAHSAGGAAIRLGEPATGSDRAVSIDVRDTSFHDRVRASRHPFMPGPPTTWPDVPLVRAARQPGMSRERVDRALWTGTPSHARRFHGLSVTAHVQCGLRTTTCDVVLGR